MSEKRTVLFYRDFRRFSGGHLKVKHYYEHVLASSEYQPDVVFSDESVWDSTNPWNGVKTSRMSDMATMKPDVLFVGGVDWDALEPYRAHFGQVPVINLIQHVKHANPGDPRFYYLSNHATRICVSEDVRLALVGTGQVNGPIYTIPNGLDIDALPKDAKERDIGLLLDGIKAPQLAQQILPALRAMELNVHALVTRIPRYEYLSWVSRARTTLFLPRTEEGFYLPALEGMALGTLVICPDCVGNRSFCISGFNSLRPTYTMEALLQAVDDARRMKTSHVEAMRNAARSTVEKHNLNVERRAFLDILSDVGHAL